MNTRLLPVSFITAVLALFLIGGTTAQGPASDLPEEVRAANGSLFAQTVGPSELSGELLPAALRRLDPDRLVSVYVVLEGASGADVALSAQALFSKSTVRRVNRRITQITAQQIALKPMLTALGAREVYSYQRLANAIQVRVPAGRLPEIARLPGVVRIDPVSEYHLTTATSVPFIGAPAVWDLEGINADGESISIGIIDTGIDYTHADFGGSGAIDDYTGNDRDVVEPGTFPTAKVVGGYDFVGDAYDFGSTDPAIYTPVPDPDPLDCNGHGTHVAGIAAGFGVLSDGTTYSGPFAGTTDFSQFAIGPGVAPEAKLYALKVFGCSGSTDVVMAALEWAADPNGDGDLTDRLDVVNISIGASFGLSESPTELQMTNRLAELGTFIAASAGNDGNTFYITGGPGNAERALSVAASIDDGIVNQAIRVTAPSPIAGLYDAVEAGFTRPLEETGPVSGTLVYAEPNAACSRLGNRRAIRGHIALIDRGTCVFVTKILNAQQARANAVVVVNNVDGPPFNMGGDSAGINIPGVMVAKEDGDIIKSQLQNGVEVLLDSSITKPRPDLADQIASFSSRGPRPLDGQLKPEIAAPGWTIESAAVGTGKDGVPLAGTSMAAPHVAGAAALMKQVHPDFSVEEIKAILMNTASETRDAEDHLYPESRVGAGRVQVDQAAQTHVTASAVGAPGAVAMSFGVLNLTDVYRETRSVRLTNHGATPVTYNVSVSDTVSQKGASLTPLSPTVTVPANGSVVVPFRFHADPTQFDMASDPTTPSTQLGAPRHRLYEFSGQIRFDGRNQSIHLPYYAAVRAASDMSAEVTHISASDGSDSQPVTIPISGTSAHPEPLVTAFQLGAESPNQNLNDAFMAGADLLAVGAASDVAARDSFEEAGVYFGIATAGEWATPGMVEFDIEIDTNRDGKADYILFNWNYATTDVFVTAVYNLETRTSAIDSWVNIMPADRLDTAPFNNNVLVLPVSVKSLGLSSSQATFDYWVRSFGVYELVDTTEVATFNAAHPAIDTAASGMGGLPIHMDGAPITVDVDRGGATLENPPRVLLLHHMNTHAKRMEIVTLN